MESIRNIFSDFYLSKISVAVFFFLLLNLVSNASEKNLFQYDKQKINQELASVQHLENNLEDAGIHSDKYVSTPEIENEIAVLKINCDSESFFNSLNSYLDDDVSLEAVCCCIGLLVLGIWALVKLIK